MGTRGRANQEELRKMKEQFSQDWMSNDVAMLDNVADAKIISQTRNSCSCFENRSFQVSDLARILGIPRIMMMEDSGSSYKMPEHATQEFMLRTIQPRIREWEDELNSKLLAMSDFGKRRIHVCELALRRLDAGRGRPRSTRYTWRLAGVRMRFAPSTTCLPSRKAMITTSALTLPSQVLPN